MAHTYPSKIRPEPSRHSAAPFRRRIFQDLSSGRSAFRRLSEAKPSKWNLKSLVLAFLLSGTALAPLYAQEGASGPTAVSVFERSGLSEISAAFEQLITNGTVPGVVMIVGQNGEIVLSRSLGFADAEHGIPMEDNTLFRVASMTKPVTSVAALILVERGEISLSDPISRYLPELADLMVLDPTNSDNTRTVAPDRPITVEDLLRHSSGFTYSFAGAAPQAVRDAYAALDVEQQATDISADEMLNRLATVPLAFQPGTRFEYSVSTDVLGFLLERVSGKPLDALLAELVFEPLNMNETGFRVVEAELTRLAQPLPTDPQTPWMNRWMRVVGDRDGAYVSGGGGLVTTAQDYYHFAQMLLNRGELEGTRILKPETVDLMLTDHVAGLEGGPEPFTGPGYGFGYGLGVRLSDEGGTTPGTQGDASWFGLGGTSFTIDRRNNIVGVLMIAAPTPRNETRFLFKNLIYEALSAGSIEGAE